MAPSFDTVGWFTAEVELLLRVAKVLLEGKQEQVVIDRIIIAEDVIAQVDFAVAGAFREWLQGVNTEIDEYITVSPEGLEVWWEVFRLIQAGEVKSTNLPWVRANKASLGPGIRERFVIAENVTDIELNAARTHQDHIVNNLNDLIPPGTVLVIPTAPCIAPLRDADAATLDAFRSNAMALTCIAGLAGLPQVSMPVLTVEGCPVGVSLIGASGCEERLLELAVTLISQDIHET